MRASILSIALFTAAASLPLASQAAGCAKGAAVGGVAGHVAGKHAVVGAAAGCAIEHHRESKADKKAASGQGQAPAAPATTAQPAPAQK